MSRRIALCVLLIFVFLTGAYTLEVTVDSGMEISYNKVPFYISANNWGDIYKDKNFQSFLGGRLKQDFPIIDKNLYFTLLVDAAVRLNESPDLNPREIYAKLNTKNFHLVGGLERTTIGDTPLPDLTSGSMAVSNNAPPVPKLTFASNGYLPLSFTGNTILVKGGMSQGVFIDDRYSDNLYLHEKWAYMKLQKEDDFSFQIGLVHEAIWDGADSDGKLTMDDILTAFIGLNGGAEADGSTVAGDALGIWDLGATMLFGDYTLHLYKHHYFEDGSGIRFQNFIDGLYGLGLEFSNSTVNKMLIEFLNTTDQSGDYHNVILQDGSNLILGGRDSYYAHGLYLSGWTNSGFTIGTPFIFTSGSGDTTRISSNRVRALVFGMEGELFENSYLLKTAFSTHYYPYTNGDADRLVSTKDGTMSFFDLFLQYSMDNIFGREGVDTALQFSFDVNSTGEFCSGASVVVKYQFY